MPAKDYYHNPVRNALIKDGWTITHDPLRLSIGERDMYVDLGAERLLAAQKESHLIAAEVKSFVGISEMTDLEKAMGQFVIYRSVMAKTHPGRILFLAVSKEIFPVVFDDPLGQLLRNEYKIPLIIVNVQT